MERGDAALFDDERRVGVGIGTVATSLAVELGLCFTVGGRGVTAAGAFLRRVVGRDGEHELGGSCRLVANELQDHSHAGVV